MRIAVLADVHVNLPASWSGKARDPGPAVADASSELTRPMTGPGETEDDVGH
jgi:hypothetical protein